MTSGTAVVADTDAAARDRDLVALAQAGDRTAFNRLVLAHQNRILTLCVRLLGDRHDGEDAAQEAFVKAYRGLKRFKGEAMFSTWLYRIAVNACRNRRRSWSSRLRSRSSSLDAPSGPDTDGPPRELGDTRMTPDKDLRRHRIAAQVKAALQQLSPIHRELIVLRDMQGKSYEEIACIVGVSLGTVKSRLARARDAMRERLEGVVDGL